MMNCLNRRRLVNALVAVAAVAAGYAGSTSAADAPGTPARKRPRTDSNVPFVHRIPLRDEGDVVIQFPKHDKPATTNPAEKGPRIKTASIVTTCGKCHDYPAINRGWHFNAGDPSIDKGRNGEPWILTDEGVLDPKADQVNTRTVLPLSYRKWPGTWAPTDVGYTDWKFAHTFGRHHPGGGVLEKSKDQRFNVTGALNNDCMVCHVADNDYSLQEKYEQVWKLQNFKYATLVAAGVGHAEKSRERLRDTWVAPDPNDPKASGPAEPPFEYDLRRVENDKVFFNLTRHVPNERCYSCHSNVDAGGQKSADLPERWRHDRDIHLAKGMLCVDCHRHGLDHMVTRGYEGEPLARKDPSLASLSCVGCHYGAAGPTGSGPKDAVGTDLGGRLAAPRPEHKGLPTLHFDKMSCTACHSGPYPGAEATAVLTSMAHRLGIESFNRVDEAAPTIQQPVFLKDKETNKITPHKVLHPTFWGRLNGARITPIAPDVLNTSALRKVLGTKPELDLQPLKPLKEEEIVKALDAIEKMEAPAPKAAAAAAATTAPTTGPTTSAATAPVAAGPPAYFTGEPVFVTGGKAYRRAGGGKLTKFDHEDARPYAWALAHDVRGAAESLGARGCTDCHASGAPVFDSKLSNAPLLIGADASQTMTDLRGDYHPALTAFAATYPMRPMLIATGFACAGVLLLVIIGYGARAVGSFGRRRGASVGAEIH